MLVSPQYIYFILASRSFFTINPCCVFIFIAVCDLAGKVYVIGGWNGQCGMKQCNIFDPVEGKWTEIEPLNYGEKDLCDC